MSDKFSSAPFYYRLFGDYALFTDPVTKGGGEKFTYQIPTYQALKGITEQIYWKPTIQYFVDAVKILEPIQTETKGVLAPLKNGKKDLNYYTYLKKVEYLVKVHFEWNELRQELENDRNEKKHEQIILRALNRGGRRDIFLGTRECIGYVERINKEDFESAETPFDGKQISYGIMFHSFVYPDEAYDEDTTNNLTSNFANIVMSNGRIDFVRPEECDIKQQLRNYSIKAFDTDSINSVDKEWREVFNK
ncbi:MAG: type I-C CRISPR-associated protein Cas5 [Anaerolineaceae bacterium]|nr:MAG: type I-C CRISPR-associated protein Cas5 [Anaerolineaceae bacterium]